MLRYFVKSGIALCITAFLAFTFYAGTESYDRATTETVSTTLAVSNIPGETTLWILFTWAPLLLTALLTLVLRRFSQPPVSKAASRTPLEQLRRLLAWQLPPRAFFADWCGGLSLAEAAGVVGWLGLNACWLGSGLRLALAGEDATWDEKLDGTAKVFGQVIAPNLMLMFLPIPHTNVITWLTGVSRNRLIRFHRWLGHGTLWVVSLHAILYYIQWGATQTFWVNFKAWDDPGNGVSNLAGSCAFFCALALWVTSLSYVRRHFYELFFRCHLLYFAGFFILSCAHYPGCWLYFTPGLLLYAVDLTLRAGQMTHVTTVVAATVDDQAATLLIQADKALKHGALTEVWLMLPTLSRWQWHPFSVASGGGRTLKLHIKQYGRFTQGLLDTLRQRRTLALRLSGPLGNEITSGCRLAPPPSWLRYKVVVMVCGGVGATAMLSMLRSMAARRAQLGQWAQQGTLREQHSPRAAQQGGQRTHHGGSRHAEQEKQTREPAENCLPRRVVCVWAARTMEEFSMLDAPLLRAATSSSGWLTLQLYLTGASTPHASARPRPFLGGGASTGIAPHPHPSLCGGSSANTSSPPRQPKMSLLASNNPKASHPNTHLASHWGSGQSSTISSSWGGGMAKGNHTWQGYPQPLSGSMSESSLNGMISSSHYGSGSHGNTAKPGPPFSPYITQQGSGTTGSPTSSIRGGRQPWLTVNVSQAGAAAGPVHIRGASPFGWTLLRPAQPLTFGTVHLALVFLLAYFGALCAALIGASYLNEEGAVQWKGGILICVLISAVAMGLPYFLVIFPVHAFRYWRGSTSVLDREAQDPAAQAFVQPYGEQAQLEAQRCIVDNSSVLLPGEGVALKAHLGRPDLAGTLHAAALESRAATVGVYAGGPEGLMRSVHLTVCQLNSRQEGAYFDLHNESVQL
ncbi:hypothetical protein N2152v2_009933 [Parachlorella kessleri]